MADRSQIRILDSLASVDPVGWDGLAGDSPFLRHAFLHALHETGCACEERGWAPRFVTLWNGAQLAGAMPLYLKSHSYGEYVFDWAWADAYHRRGLDYY
ncbi:MAG TPA: peptidogalycan biosysnthesis protein, partial [Burkholderiales bacterium]|nr:peptidogalycan biosysnthesis protein [Burkholderiales bacterium]